MLLLLAALVALAERPQEPVDRRGIEVSSEPDIRYYWDGIPDERAEGALHTADFSNIEPSDFVGPDACRECHEDKYLAWSGHRHRFMNAPARADTVRGDFTGAAEIRYFGGTARFTTEDDRYLMRLERDGARRVYRVTQTIGSRFFQYYVGVQLEGPEPRADPLYTSEHVLPFGFWLEPREWVPVVHVEKTREGEPSLVDSMRRDPYTDPAAFDYARSCSQCHTTLPTGDWLIHRTPSFPESPRGFGFDVGAYVTDNHGGLLEGRTPESVSDQEARNVLRDITSKKAPVLETASGISCEACHYGNRNHVDSAGVILPNLFPTSPRLALDRREDGVGLERNPTNQNWTCGRCHQGTRFEFAGGMSTWNSTEHTDALEGACYTSSDPARATLRCIDCHNPHETTGLAWSRSPDEDDALCLRCHEPLAPQSARLEHTHHPAASPGSRCMNCHMPRINEGLQDMVRTHTIFSPTNEKMIDSNQPNACNMCHVRETQTWTLTYLERWYGRSFPNTAPSQTPATIQWLKSWHPTTQMVAADVLTRADAEWALADLVESLDSKYMLVRQFAQIGLERMLDVRLDSFGYRFYMFSRERDEPLRALRDRYALERARPTATETADEGLAHYRSLVQFKPDSPTAHYYLGNVLLEQGVLDEAEEHYRTAVELDPTFARARNNLGIVLKEAGRATEAMEQHLDALTLEPDLAEAKVAIGNLHLATGQTALAREAFQSAVELSPGLAEGHYNLGLLLHAEGKRDDAIAAYRRAVSAEPSYAAAYNNLGIALAEKGRTKDAIESLERALDGPNDVVRSAHNNLGWTYLLDEHPDEAVPHFEAVLEQDDGSVSAQVGLARALASPMLSAMANPERAIELATAANQATGGQSAEVLDALARAYAAAGQFPAAVEAAEAALELMSSDTRLAREINDRLSGYRARAARP